MNRKSEPSRKGKWTAALALIALLAAPALARSVEISAEPATPMLLAGAERTAYVRVALRGLATEDGARAPLNVAIVLDRSGSMQGRKIEEAKNAAVMALDWLRDDDIVSVITYQSTVNVLVPATKLTDRERVIRAIRSISAGGNTALFAGVSKGAREVRKFLDLERVNLVILLSDGLANVGPSSPGDLAELGSSLLREGIAVTTIGLGLDYNEDLMTRLAYRSDGNHFFVERASDLARAYATEFGDVVSVVAQDVGIRIRCTPGVRPVRVLGREAEIVGQDVYAEMSQLFRDQTRYLILEVRVPAGRQGLARKLADVAVDYADIASGRRMTLNSQLAVSFTDSPQVVERMTDREVMIAVASQLGAEAAEAAMALRDAGSIDEAKAAFLANSAFLSDFADKYDDDGLARDASLNIDTSRNLAEEQWVGERKTQQEYQLKTRQQRAYVEGDEDKKDAAEKKND